MPRCFGARVPLLACSSMFFDGFRRCSGEIEGKTRYLVGNLLILADEQCIVRFSRQLAFPLQLSVPLYRLVEELDDRRGSESAHRRNLWEPGRCAEEVDCRTEDPKCT